MFLQPKPVAMQPTRKNPVLQKRLRITKRKTAPGCSDAEGCTEATPDANNATHEVAVANTDEQQKVQVVAYYFHGDVRCATWPLQSKIFQKKLLNTKFAKQLKSGTLVFKDVNIDEEKNEHYIDEYELASSSLVVARFENGKRKEWKNLEKVWQLVGDRDAFMDYTTK